MRAPPLASCSMGVDIAADVKPLEKMLAASAKEREGLTQELATQLKEIRHVAR